MGRARQEHAAAIMRLFLTLPVVLILGCSPELGGAPPGPSRPSLTVVTGKPRPIMGNYIGLPVQVTNPGTTAVSIAQIECSFFNSSKVLVLTGTGTVLDLPAGGSGSTELVVEMIEPMTGSCRAVAID